MKAVFWDIAHVVVCAPHVMSEIRCSCSCFCRYRGCEHATFVGMLELRLRSPTIDPTMLPVVRSTGRQTGARLTVRTQREAAAVAKRQARAKPRPRVATAKKVGASRAL